jgi:hypothetical protein
VTASGAFSPPKSVSLLWAAGDQALQRQVWAAHLAAVDAGLGYLEEHAGYVRAGRNGVRVLDTSGLVVARMNEWTSRDGDMHLHTHCLVLNRAQTLEDGKWRALDGRALLSARTGAGALYNRVVEAELTRRLGVAWRDPNRGRPASPAGQPRTPPRPTTRTHSPHPPPLATSRHRRARHPTPDRPRPPAPTARPQHPPPSPPTHPMNPPRPPTESDIPGTQEASRTMCVRRNSRGYASPRDTRYPGIPDGSGSSGWCLGRGTWSRSAVAHGGPSSG